MRPAVGCAHARKSKCVHLAIRDTLGRHDNRSAAAWAAQSQRHDMSCLGMRCQLPAPAYGGIFPRGDTRRAHNKISLRSSRTLCKTLRGGETSVSKSFWESMIRGVDAKMHSGRIVLRDLDHHTKIPLPRGT